MGGEIGKWLFSRQTLPAYSIVLQESGSFNCNSFRATQQILIFRDSAGDFQPGFMEKSCFTRFRLPNPPESRPSFPF